MFCICGLCIYLCTKLSLGLGDFMGKKKRTEKIATKVYNIDDTDYNRWMMSKWVEMSEWVNDWTDEWVNEWMNEWTDEWMNEWKN